MDKAIWLCLVFGCALSLIEFVNAGTEHSPTSGQVQIQLLDSPVSNDHHISKRKVMLFENHNVRKWPNEIFYYIDPIFSGFGSEVIHSIIQDEFQAKTCLNFTKLTYRTSSRQQYIYFKYHPVRTECQSYIGMSDGWFSNSGQPILLGANCFSLRGHLIFLLASTLGMFSEIKRPDRDMYVDIFPQNYALEAKQLFSIESTDSATTHGVPYDYGSVMHIAAKDWLSQTLQTDLTKFTVLPKDRRYSRSIGQQSEFSFYDVMALNRAYCPDACASSNVVCQNGGFLDPRDCLTCECPDGFGGHDCKDVTGSQSCRPSSGQLSVQSHTSCVTSPYFESEREYDDGATCAWLLKAPEDKRIDAWFESLDLPSLSTGFTPCMHWVELKLGGSEDVRGPRYCNNGSSPDLSPYFRWENVDPDFAIPSINKPITSEQNEMMAIFKAPDYKAHEDQVIPGRQASSGFKMCYKISAKIAMPTTRTTTQATHPNHEKQTADESSGSSNHLTLIATLVGVLLLVVIVLLMVLIYCVYRRRKRSQMTQAPAALPHHAAFTNPGYGASGDVHISRIVQNNQAVDEIKKHPESLDFSHVGQHGDVSGVMPSFEPPPKYEETAPSADVADPAADSSGFAVMYNSTADDSEYDNYANTSKDVQGDKA